MKTFAIAAAMSGVTLCAAGGVSAQQLYEWSPQKTVSHLSGTLTFLPGVGNGGNFQCKVDMTFKTGNVSRGIEALPRIISATAEGKGCKAVLFTDLPWYVGANDAQDETISRYGWNGGIEACDAPDGGNFFYVPQQGPGDVEFDRFSGCLSGTLTSNPPVSVVLKP